MTLQKLSADWGEGSSSGGGQGSAAATNDATWTQRFFPGTNWSTPGGDFSSTVSATTLVTGTGAFSWSAAGMVSDLQSWLDAPGTNFGWILRGDETGADRTVKRLNSKDSGASPPTLTVNFDEPAPALTVSIVADSVSESAGAAATTATVTRGGSTASALTVSLSSSDTSEITVPASVTIAAGQSVSAAFNINAVDDAIVDGTQTVTVTASATGATDGTDTVDVTDDDVAALTLNIAADSFSESAGNSATTATVSRNTDTTNALTVTLASSDTTEATVPASVTIGAGQATSSAFAIHAVDDSLVDGTQTVTVTGSAPGHADGTDTVDVTDDDVAAMVIGHQFNAGQANRSGLASLLLQFSGPVTLETASSLKVWNHTAGAAVDLSSATLSNDGTTDVTVDLSSVSFGEGNHTFKLPASLGLAATHTIEAKVVPGDSSGDGQVSFADFGDLAAAFNTVGGPRYGPGDMNGDGSVTFADFGILAGNFNKIVGPEEMDFGDALETGTSFPVSLPNGARHILGSGLLLGSSVDAESNGQPNVGATGDGVDEDGVVFPPLIGGTTPTFTVTAVVPTTAVLNAWIDFNRDTDWDDPGEQIFVDQAVVTGVNSLAAAIPVGALAGPTYARFRITGCAGHTYFGLAPDGEVEDYFVTLAAPLQRPIGGGLLNVSDVPSAAATSTVRRAASPATDADTNGFTAEAVDLAIEQVVPERQGRGPLVNDSPPADDLLDELFQQQDDLL